MQKYKLLKDLPLAKAGEIVSINEQNRKKHLNEIAIMKDSGTIAYVKKDTIGAWLEEIQELKSVWELRNGDTIYELTSHWVILSQKWKGYLYQSNLRKNGNLFLTHEEAKEECDRRQAIAKIQKYCYENNINNTWTIDDYGIHHYCFCFSPETEQVEFFLPQDDQKPYSPIGYFSYKNAQTILENFPESLELIYS